ncbi:MAG TPA: hypothetical protein VGP72_12445 [Planctomycetota bacterium]|jgi:hypothetical protein
MTETEARELLPMYADGLLEDGEAKAVEAVVAQAPDLQDELARLRRENEELSALMNENLAALRPTRSARMRISEAMLDVHRRAEEAADSLPERGWRIFRWAFSLTSLVLGLLAVWLFPRKYAADESVVLFYIEVVFFLIGNVFVLAGPLLAEFESKLVGVVSKDEVEPSGLEKLTLVIFGVVSVLVASGLFIYQNF